MARRALPFPCAWLAVPERSWRPDGALLTASEAMVLAAFVDRWRRSDEDAFVLSTDDLSRLSGLSARGAETARDSLLERRLIVQVHVGGGRGRPSVYRLGSWSKPGSGNEETAAETPNENPATPAWLEQKPAPNPAPNPAGFSAVGAGNAPATPLSLVQRSEAEAEGERAALRGFDSRPLGDLACSAWTRVLAERGRPFQPDPSKDAGRFRAIGQLVDAMRGDVALTDALEASARKHIDGRRTGTTPEYWLGWLQREASHAPQTERNGVSPIEDFDPSPLPARTA